MSEFLDSKHQDLFVFLMHLKVSLARDANEEELNSLSFMFLYKLEFVALCDIQFFLSILAKISMQEKITKICYSLELNGRNV